MSNSFRWFPGGLKGAGGVARYLKTHGNVLNIAISATLAGAICGSLLLATPVAAVELSLPNLPGTAYFSTVVTFDARVDILANEAIPIQSIRIDATGPTSAWVSFNPDGNVTGQSGQFGNISVVDTPYLGYGYGYASGFGYDSSTGQTGNFSSTWNPSVNYGYGATDPSHRTTRATYRITLNTASLALGTYNVQMSVNVPPSPTKFLSSVYTFTVMGLSGGGGGGGGTGSTPAPTSNPVEGQLGTTDLSEITDNTGAFQQTLTIRDDNTVGPLQETVFNVPQNTVGLDKDGHPLTALTMVEMTTPPAPPANRAVIGLPYNFGPDGATFSPAATITFIVDTTLLPNGVTPNDLVIAYFNSATNTWVELPTTYNASTHTLTASVAHFTAIGILAKTAAATSIPQPPAANSPAAFKLGPLVLSSPEVGPNEKVEISTTVSNTGGETGKYSATFKVNGIAESTKEVTVAAGGNEKVTFSTAQSLPGTYAVEVNGLMGTFTVKASAPAGEPSSFTPVVTLVLLLVGVSAGILAYLVWRRHKAQTT